MIVGEPPWTSQSTDLFWNCSFFSSKQYYRYCSSIVVVVVVATIGQGAVGLLLVACSWWDDDNANVGLLARTYVLIPKKVYRNRGPKTCEFHEEEGLTLRVQLPCLCDQNVDSPYSVYYIIIKTVSPRRSGLEYNAMVKLASSLSCHHRITILGTARHNTKTSK